MSRSTSKLSSPVRSWPGWPQPDRRCGRLVPVGGRSFWILVGPWNRIPCRRGRRSRGGRGCRQLAATSAPPGSAWRCSATGSAPWSLPPDRGAGMLTLSRHGAEAWDVRFRCISTDAPRARWRQIEPTSLGGSGSPSRPRGPVRRHASTQAAPGLDAEAPDGTAPPGRSASPPCSRRRRVPQWRFPGRVEDGGQALGIASECRTPRSRSLTVTLLLRTRTICGPWGRPLVVEAELNLMPLHGCGGAAAPWRRRRPRPVTASWSTWDRPWRRPGAGPTGRTVVGQTRATAVLTFSAEARGRDEHRHRDARPRRGVRSGRVPWGRTPWARRASIASIVVPCLEVRHHQRGTGRNWPWGAESTTVSVGAGHLVAIEHWPR